MTAALSIVPIYMAFDCDHDVTGDLIEVSLDKVTWKAALWEAPSSALIAAANASCAVPAGLTRYWVRIYTGGTGADALPLLYGSNLVHGRLTDSPAVPYVVWRVVMPPD